MTFFGLADSGPDGTQNEKATIASLVAGGNADAVWFYAEVATESSGPGGKESATTRVVEIASAAERWRVVAASFGEASELLYAADNWEIAGATSADGPLAKLLGSPRTVGAQLAADAIVVGPKAAAYGAGARDALAAWKFEPRSPCTSAPARSQRRRGVSPRPTSIIRMGDTRIVSRALWSPSRQRGTTGQSCLRRTCTGRRSPEPWAGMPTHGKENTYNCQLLLRALHA